MRLPCVAPVALLACCALAPGGALGAGAEPLFVEAGAAAGLRFIHRDGDRGRLDLRAIMGPGAALLDYDGDGDLDVFLVQGGELPGDGVGATDVPAGKPPSSAVPADLPGGARLLRNDLLAPLPESPGVSAGPAFRLVDVTARAGIVAAAYGHGVAVGDVDGDGTPDLFLANLGDPPGRASAAASAPSSAMQRDALWRNRGDGTFADASADLGPPVAGWSSAGSFFDAEGDGDLDLYVARYVAARPEVRCFAESSRRDYCGPAAYLPLPDRLLRNDGRGRFADVSLPSGVGRLAAPALGVIAGDFDGVPGADLWVANDGAANLLWLRQGAGDAISYREDGALAGVALSREGLARAGMGVDAGDADGDGDEDLVVTNLTAEPHTLYLQQAPGVFEDRTAESGLAAPTLPWTGFGVAFLDADLDGWLDLLVADGAVRLAHATGGDQTRSPRGLAQPAQLLRNVGRGRYVEASAAGGSAVTAPAVGRGLATGDLDGDGDTDALLAVNGDAPRLLLAQPPGDPVWTAVAPCPGLADARWLGQIVRVEVAPAAGGTTLPVLFRRPHRDGSYASARDPRVTAGMGAGGQPVAVTTTAQNRGIAQQWRRPAARRYLLWCAPPGGER